MNIQECDEKIKMKKELANKMQEEIDRRKARLDKLNAEIEQLEDNKAKVFGYDWLEMMEDVGVSTADECADLKEQFRQFLLERQKLNAETVASDESAKSAYSTVEEVTAFEDEQAEELEELVDDTEDVAEDFETDSTSGYSNSLYQQGRNFYRNNNQ